LLQPPRTTPSAATTKTIAKIFFIYRTPPIVDLPPVERHYG
jgi:hypothetical protein